MFSIAAESAFCLLPGMISIFKMHDIRLGQSQIHVKAKIARLQLFVAVPCGANGAFNFAACEI